jgi:hypothetical protein
VDRWTGGRVDAQGGLPSHVADTHVRCPRTLSMETWPSYIISQGSPARATTFALSLSITRAMCFLSHAKDLETEISERVLCRGLCNRVLLIPGVIVCSSVWFGLGTFDVRGLGKGLGISGFGGGVGRAEDDDDEERRRREIGRLGEQTRRSRDKLILM